MIRKVLMLFVRFYQVGISPVLPSRCIHVPTCSQYVLEAVDRHGAIHGLWLGVKRLLHCHPFSRGGYDPVP